MNTEEEEALKKTLKELIEIKEQQNAELRKSIESEDNFMFFVRVSCIIFGICGLIWLSMINFVY